LILAVWIRSWFYRDFVGTETGTEMRSKWELSSSYGSASFYRYEGRYRPGVDLPSCGSYSGSLTISGSWLSSWNGGGKYSTFFPRPQPTHESSWKIPGIS